MNAKICFIPTCRNNSDDSPKKLFVTVPANIQRRKNWFNAANLEFTTQVGHDMHCCEDHFNLEDDVVNWMFFKTIGSRLKLKPHIVPHKFLNQLPPTCNNSSVLTDEDKKRKAELLENLLNKRKKQVKEYAEPSSSKNLKASSSVPVFIEEGTVEICLETSFIDVQTDIKQPFTNKSMNTEYPTSQNAFTTTIHHVMLGGKSGMEPCLKQAISRSDEPLSPPISRKDLNSSTYLCEITDKLLKSRRRRNICAIEQKSRFHLGIPEHMYRIVHLICVRGRISYEDSLITLKKIRHNDEYQKLAIDFGVSMKDIQRIVTLSVPKIAHVLQNLIFWPDPIDIKKNLPMTFRAHYRNVQSILDCFEIEIKEPSDPVVQTETLTCMNTHSVQFLLSCTPNGFINFISKTYGGGIKYIELFKKCAYLDVLPTNASIMLHGDLRDVASDVAALVQEKGCEVVEERSQHVSSQVESTSLELEDGEMISSLTIQVERVIVKVQNFSILDPNSHVDQSLLPLLSYIAIIACALVNIEELQESKCN